MLYGESDYILNQVLSYNDGYLIVDDEENEIEKIEEDKATEDMILIIAVFTCV